MAQKEKEVDAPKRALVLDANILLRAVLGRRARSLIERYHENVSLFIPSACVREVHKYLPSLCLKRDWDVRRAFDQLQALLALISIAEEGLYTDFEEAARHRIGERDADDWPVVALALMLNADVWTEDNDFFGSGLPTWTTDTVEIYLNNDPLQVNEPASVYAVEVTA